MTAIELSDEQAEQLKAQAQARGLTVGEWIAPAYGPHRSEAGSCRWTAGQYGTFLRTALNDIFPEDRALHS